MKGRRRTTIFRPGLMSNLIIYYKLINYKCMDNIMKCTPLGEQKSLWLRKTLLIMKFFVLFLLLGTVPCWAGHRLFTECEDVFGHGKYYGA